MAPVIVCVWAPRVELFALICAKLLLPTVPPLKVNVPPPLNVTFCAVPLASIRAKLLLPEPEPPVSTMLPPPLTVMFCVPADPVCVICALLLASVPPFPPVSVRPPTPTVMACVSTEVTSADAAGFAITLMPVALMVRVPPALMMLPVLLI